jgi:hypothetical protein
LHSHLQGARTPTHSAYYSCALDKAA